MTGGEYQEIVEKVSYALVSAGSTFSDDKFDCYKTKTGNGCVLSDWVIDQVLENAEAAKKNRTPLCDDTGIPHVILEVGRDREVSGELLSAIYDGIKEGLQRLPGRPMAVMGTDWERVSQSGGLCDDSEAVLPAPFMIRYSDDAGRLRLTVLMQGGGPEIRAKTYRVFHRHNADTVINQIIDWALESVADLGCSPCTIAVGIGRSHYEAGSLMLQAMADGNHAVQSDVEKRITDAVNERGTGAMGLGGDVSVLATFIKVGPQRASGVRIVSMRPCCCFEPRKAGVDL